MGLSWQQGPLAPGAIGRFLVPGPVPERLLFAEPLRRRMRVKFGGEWIADSEDVVLLVPARTVYHDVRPRSRCRVARSAGSNTPSVTTPSGK